LKGEIMPHSPLVYKVAEDYLTFTEALEQVYLGKVVARESWQETEPDCRCAIQGEQLCIFRKAEEDEEPIWHPWVITTGDMVGEDWIVVGE
jgi:hypothetical protein